MKNEIQIDNLYNRIADLIHKARQSIVRTVDYTMVYTYFEIGRMIVEDEQQGKERAEYGKQLLKNLSKRLQKDFGKGFLVQNLENMRKFYLLYRQRIEKSQSLMRISNLSEFQLSWTHYLILIRMDKEKVINFFCIISSSREHHNGV